MKNRVKVTEGKFLMCLDSETRAKLDYLARMDGRSSAAVIRRLIVTYFDVWQEGQPVQYGEEAANENAKDG